MSDQAAVKNPLKEEPKTPGGIFSRESAETIRSPEKLNEHIRAVTTGTWILIAALALVMAALIFWGVTGSIPVYLSAKGVGVSWDTDEAVSMRQQGNFSESNMVNAVICPVDASGNATAASLDGKQARAVFRDGHAVTGTTRVFDSVPHSKEEVEGYLSEYLLDYSGWFFSQLSDYDYSYIVMVELDAPADLYYWKDIADVSIVTDEVHPAAFLFH
jgi:hypothetical protein